MAFDDVSGAVQWSFAPAGGAALRVVSALAEPAGGVMVQDLATAEVRTFNRAGAQLTVRTGTTSPLSVTSDGLMAIDDGRQTSLEPDAEPGGVWAVPEVGNSNNQGASPVAEIRVSAPSVTRGTLARFNVTGVGDFDIHDWSFVPSDSALLTIVRPPSNSQVTWEGYMATGGSARVTLVTGRNINPRRIRVVKRTRGWKSISVPAVEVPNGTYNRWLPERVRASRQRDSS